MVKHRHQQQLPVAAKMTSSPGIQNITKMPETEWETVQMPMASSHKRTTAEMTHSSSTSKPMKTEPNAEKVEQLRTKIAILQQELAIETQIPEGPVKISRKARKDPSEFQSPHFELLTEEQVLMLHEKISNRISGIKGVLSSLKEKSSACPWSAC